MNTQTYMQMKVGNRKIGPGNPIFIVAEMSGNHNGSYKRALKIIDAAAEAGADAVKLQTYTPDTITIDCDKKYFQVKTKLWRGQTLYNLYKKTYTPWEWQPKLKKYAAQKGLILFSSPFDNTAVDFLEKMKVGLYKVASHELVDTPLLKRIGKTKKPVIMSRGMASVQEIRSAIKTLKDNGAPQVAVLHCISSYPARPQDMNLRTIPDIIRRFKVISGLSDHGLENNAAIGSVILGASIIEKHITLKRSGGGPDSAFSLEPEGFKELVRSVRQVELSLGRVHYGAGIFEVADLKTRKSLFVVKDIKKGERLTPDNIKSIRPGQGLKPKYYDDVMGKIAKCDIERGTPLSWDLIKK